MLDILLDRQPHAAASGAIWVKIEKGEASGFVPAHGLTTIHYLVERERGAQIARQAVEGIVQVLAVAPVDGAVVRSATLFPGHILKTLCVPLLLRQPHATPSSVVIPSVFRIRRYP